MQALEFLAHSGELWLVFTLLGGLSKSENNLFSPWNPKGSSKGNERPFEEKTNYNLKGELLST